MDIGIDPHKLSHTASAVDSATNTSVASLRVDASLAGYRELMRWAGQFEDRRWAIENARGLGRHLAQWLLARDETVVDVPCTATARVRELSRGGRRKNDVIDASAAACVAAAQGDASPVLADDHTVICAMLEERRSNVSGQRVRVANQLHAVLRELVAGGAPRQISAGSASALLRSVRPANAVEQCRKQLARHLVKDLKALDSSLVDIEKRMAEAVTEIGSRLCEIDGVAAVTAARLIGRTGPASRFRNEHAFAAYVGTAPIEIASGDQSHHRSHDRAIAGSTPQST